MRVQVGLQFIERQLGVDRLAVANDMHVAFLEIYDAHTVEIGDEGVADGPLIRHLPVETRRTGRHFVRVEGHDLFEDTQSLPHAFAGDRTADRKQSAEQRVGQRGQVWCSHARWVRRLHGVVFA